VIALVNAELVPVWINVRTTPLPDIPALRPIVGGLDAKLDEDGRVEEKRRGFFVVSAVTTGDGAILLNPEPTDHPVAMLFDEGHFPYARVNADDYLAMLHKALSYVRRDE
jgi:hypothetical protein